MDREKVIKGIDICLNRFHCGAECPYYDNSGCQEQLRDDALSLLQEQEEQIKNRDESLEKAREEIKWLRGMLKEQEPVEPSTDIVRNRRCPKCFMILKGKFCHECGQAVKWE